MREMLGPHGATFRRHHCIDDPFREPLEEREDPLHIQISVTCYSAVMSELAEKKCVACEGGTAPLNKEEADVLLKQLNGWTLSGDARWISKDFKFSDFAAALAFVNKVGALAEQEGHHPDVQLSWGRVAIELTTHAIDGLSENDFILAAKIDKLS